MGKKHREGFTLIELLVLMMVMALALGLGIPAITAAVANGHMSTAANDLVSSIHAARSDASARGRSVTLCASSRWADPRPECEADASLLGGWIVFVDANVNGTVEDDEAILQAHGPLDEAIRLQAESGADTGPPHYLSFRPDGPAQEIGAAPPVRHVQLCDERGDRATGTDAEGREIAAGRWIAITATGRPQLHRLRGEVQGNALGGCRTDS